MKRLVNLVISKLYYLVMDRLVEHGYHYFREKYLAPELRAQRQWLVNATCHRAAYTAALARQMCAERGDWRLAMIEQTMIHLVGNIVPTQEALAHALTEGQVALRQRQGRMIEREFDLPDITPVGFTSEAASTQPGRQLKPN